jgi:hypothetical protein
MKSRRPAHHTPAHSNTVTYPDDLLSVARPVVGTSSRATRTREASGGEDHPAILNRRDPAPVDSQGDAGRYPALKRPRQGQAATPSPSAILDPSTGPGPETPAALAAPGRPANLAGKSEPMSVNSIESNPPIELTDMRCPNAQRHQFMVGGRLITREMPCDVKACEVCGPRLRRELVDEWAQAMASDRVFRLVVDGDQVAKLRRQKRMVGQQLAHLPGPDGTRVVYTTAPIGEAVDNVHITLTSDVAADPGDGRRRSKLSDGWAQVVADARAEREAKREPWEWLGRVSRSLEHVEMVARDLGILVGRMPDMVIVEAPDPLARALFLKRIRCKGPWQEWGDAAGKAVAA